LRISLHGHPHAQWVIDLVPQPHLRESFDADPAVAAAVRKIFVPTNREVVHANSFRDDSNIKQRLQAHGLRV